MASTYSKYSIAKSTSIKNLNQYNVEDIQSWFKSLNIRENVIPKGWKTSKQLREMLSISESSMKRYIKNGLKEGTIEMKKFRSKGLINQIIPFYRQIKKSGFSVEKN